MCVLTHAHLCGCQRTDNLRELIFFFCSVYPRNKTRVTRLGDMPLATKLTLPPFFE